MASTVLDVRDTRVPSPPTDRARRCPPAPVVAAGVVAVLEAIALVAGALTGLDGLLTSPLRPSGGLVALTLVLLAGWVVLCAGGGATVVDGSGRTMLVGVAYGELLLVGGLLVATQVTTVLDPLPATLPLPAVVLLALAVPVGKLLLAGAPSALEWVAAGPRAPVRRARHAPVRRGLRAATVTAIGVALAALALLGPAPVDAGEPVTTPVSGG
ncbi:MAG TPA: hypothetical protein VHF92_04940 [Geodermatophilus sp.]|nr:hypothetical protein [Geodermatophilus sp.]